MAEGHDAIYEWIAARCPPVPRDVVAAMPFDAHIAEWRREGYRETAATNPWAGSGHYGKERGLFMAGHKRLALTHGDVDEEAWVEDYREGRVVFVLSMGSIFVVRPLELDLVAKVLEAGPDGGAALGLALGYQPEDVRHFVGRLASTVLAGFCR